MYYTNCKNKEQLKTVKENTEINMDNINEFSLYSIATANVKFAGIDLARNMVKVNVRFLILINFICYYICEWVLIFM